MNKGKIVQVIGPVVDVEFGDSASLPGIYNAVTVDFTVLGKTSKLTLEVQQHLGDNWVRTIAMSSKGSIVCGIASPSASATHSQGMSGPLSTVSAIVPGKRGLTSSSAGVPARSRLHCTFAT